MAQFIPPRELVMVGEQGQEWAMLALDDNDNIYIGGRYNELPSEWVWNGENIAIGNGNPGDMESLDEWRCPYCGTLNPGTSRKCGNQFTGCQASKQGNAD